MAGDLDLTRVSAPLPAEAKRELEYPKPTEDPKWSEEQFEAPDVSGQRRAALEEAIAVEHSTPKGRLVIEQDKESGRFVQKVLDPESGEVVLQWPEEKFLEMARQMGKAYGVLVDQKV